MTELVRRKKCIYRKSASGQTVIKTSPKNHFGIQLVNGRGYIIKLLQFHDGALNISVFVNGRDLCNYLSCSPGCSAFISNLYKINKRCLFCCVVFAPGYLLLALRHRSSSAPSQKVFVQCWIHHSPTPRVRRLLDSLKRLLV